ncbi:MAG TPA: protein kinase [Thermoanaerobaculia bacterium]|nr:protein kinase [Thermoanaerobaculia bacterium]
MARGYRPCRETSLWLGPERGFRTGTLPHLLTPGTCFGPYEIESALAEGGMGEVYKARDRRLDRTVALKVLPEHLSRDPEMRKRFEREARAISALSHPNICALYDIGNADGQEFLVMEYLEGETLAERVSHGPLELDQVIKVGVEIGDALEKAHRQGIIHRDLKPGNVVLTKSGAKLLDFGLAKWMPADEHSILGRAEDVTKPLTMQGTLLGTIPYMSPEQLEGKEVEAQSDIFSFGAILYEMATGVRAFNAGSNASLIASILREDPPPVSRLRHLLPRGLDQIIRTCLNKNPEERFQSAHDVRLALQMLGSDTYEVPDRQPARPRRWLVPLLTAVIVLLAMLVAALTFFRPAKETPPVYRFTIAAPLGSAFPGLGEGGAFALSPDGRQLVFEGTTPDGRTYLWLRALDSESPAMLKPTVGAKYPFWSPDGQSIAFFADGKLKRMVLPDGPAQTIADAPTARGGTWSRGGVIVFAPASSGALYRVAAGGGPPEPVTTPAPDMYSHRWPVFIGETRFLYVVQSARSAVRGVYAGSLDSKETKRVLPAAASVAFVPPHHLFHVRDHVLVRQQFDPRRLELTGDPATVADRMIYYADRAYVPVSASAGGTIAYRRDGASNMRVIWYGRDGRRLGAIGEMGEYEGVSISPDGTRVAFGYFDPNESLNHIAIAAKAAVPRRFTFARGNQYSPIWSPDGTRLAFSDDEVGVDTLAAKPLAGTSNEKALIPVPPSSTYAQSWSPDGESILYRVQNAKSGFDVHVLSVTDGKTWPYLQGPSDESQAQFSPDGLWVAYASTESGQPEVYVQPFPATGAKWQVSVGGGEQPRWRRDGKELFYLAANRNLMTVPIAVPGAFDAESPRVLFPTDIPFGDLSVSQAYDVTPDGERFAIAGPDPVTPQSPISIVTR